MNRFLSLLCLSLMLSSACIREQEVDNEHEEQTDIQLVSFSVKPVKESSLRFQSQSGRMFLILNSVVVEDGEVVVLLGKEDACSLGITEDEYDSIVSQIYRCR